MNSKIYVAQSYTVGLDRIRPSTPELLLRSAIKDFTDNRPNLRTEYVNSQPVATSRHECEAHCGHCKYFFDYDRTYDIEERPDDPDLQQTRQQLIQTVKDIMEVTVGAERDSYAVHTAQRHGPLPDGKFKVSFRLFVSGCKTSPCSIKNAIVESGCKEFDLSVYSRNRRLCMILGSKNKQDSRKLVPSNEEITAFKEDRPNKEPLQDPDFLKQYLATYVEEDWPLLEKDLDHDTARDNAPDSSEDEQTTERPARVRRSIPQVPSFETIRELLQVSGFHNPRQVHPSYEEGTSIKVAFDCDSRDDCPLCHKQHDNQNWLAIIDTKSGVAVRNLSERCFLAPLMSPHFLAVPIQQTIAQNVNQAAFARWYLDSRQGTLLYHQGTGCFHTFKDQKWTQLSDEVVMESISGYLMHNLFGSQQQRVDLWYQVATELGLRDAVIKQIKKKQKVIKKTINTIGTVSTISAVFRFMKGQAFTESTMFDTNHDLLHFTNGVLDLNTKEFRDSKPIDFNTLTTGYDYDNNPAQSAVEFHEEFIRKIYPDPAIREVAQRVMGATLSGYNHAKKLFIFTDEGGELGGNNGKTQIFRLHQLCLGDYAVTPKKDVLYDGQVNAEAANPNMAKLRGKRAAIVEELEPHKKLAEGLVKEITNGNNPIFPVRDLYKSTSLMEVCAKVMIGCNHGKFPRFDPYDEALTNRFMPVPHISHFTTESHKWDPVRHVYPASSEVAEKMNDPDVRMAHMLWCLEGYDNYKRLGGFSPNTLPNSILDFKRVLIFKNTPVYAYLGEVLEETERLDRDMLTMKAVWELYKKDRRSNKYLTMEQFTASFRVYVNSRIPNSFQYQGTGQNRVPYARGFQIRADASDSTYGVRIMGHDADHFL